MVLLDSVLGVIGIIGTIKGAGMFVLLEGKIVFFIVIFCLMTFAYLPFYRKKKKEKIENKWTEN